MTALLTVGGLSVRSPAGPNLVARMSFTLARGQRLGLAGPSGSGKSLAALAIAGLLPDELHADGSVRLEGREILFLGERERAKLRGRRIAMIFQEPMTALDPIRRIGAQVAAPMEIHGLHAPAERRERATELLAAVGLARHSVPPSLFPHQLSGGQRQRVMIAAALAAEPDILLADEPTTALDSVVQRHILDLLGRLAAERDLALMLISHDPAVLRHVCDGVIELQHGEIGGRPAPGKIADRPQTLPVDATGRSDRPLLEAVGLQKRYRVPGSGSRLAVADVSVRIEAGESVGLIGSSGSGKSTLARMLVGLENPDRGEIRLDGRNPAAPDRRDHSVQLVFQDPYDSLDPRWKIGRVVAEPLAGEPLAAGERHRRVGEALREVDLPEDSVDRYPHMLSGGQRQRVAIARAIVARPRLLVLDEPVSALDQRVRGQIVELLDRLRRRHRFGLLVISHDLPVVAELCSRVLVMADGQIVERGPVAAILAAPVSDAARALKVAALGPTVAPQQIGDY